MMSIGMENRFPAAVHLAASTGRVVFGSKWPENSLLGFDLNALTYSSLLVAPLCLINKSPHTMHNVYIVQ